MEQGLHVPMIVGAIIRRKSPRAITADMPYSGVSVYWCLSPGPTDQSPPLRSTCCARPLDDRELGVYMGGRSLHRGWAQGGRRRRCWW